MKDALAKDYVAQQATKNLADDAQGFTDAVYEKSKTLQPAADKYKLQIQTATVGAKPDPQLPPDSPLNNPKFLSAVFASDSVKDHNNTQAIDIGNSTLIAARVTDYKPATVPALDTVKDAVRAKVVAEEAAAIGEEGRRREARRLAEVELDGGFLVGIHGLAQRPARHAARCVERDLQGGRIEAAGVCRRRSRQ